MSDPHHEIPGRGWSTESRHPRFDKIAAKKGMGAVVMKGFNDENVHHQPFRFAKDPILQA